MSDTESQEDDLRDMGEMQDTDDDMNDEEE